MRATFQSPLFLLRNFHKDVNRISLRSRIGSAVPDNAERDSRSIFIGNVDFSCSVEEVQVLKNRACNNLVCISRMKVMG
jgi:hypothetical protein